MSFVNNVNIFWNWFEENVDKFNTLISNKSLNELREEISNKLNTTFNGIPFVIGCKRNNYELFLSPEGDIDRLYLSRYWMEQAPQIPNWKFYHIKPPNTNLNFNLKFDRSDICVGPDDFFILLKPNKKIGKIDLEVYCEKLFFVDDEEKLRYVFIMLDECLGEGYTETAIGKIDFARKKSRKMIPISELYNAVITTFSENDWELFESPDQIFTTYELQPDTDSNKYRDDIVFGYTSNLNLIDNHLQSTKEGIDYMHSVGAEYIFMTYDHQNIPHEQKVSFRGGIEDRVVSILDTYKLGYHLGGATGITNSYIDLLIFDMDEFNKQISGILENFNVKIECISF